MIYGQSMKIQSQLAAAVLLLCSSCGRVHNVETNSTASNLPAGCKYETQWISYPDSAYRNRTNICEVKYYCEGNIIYTSEKFHFITLAYSWDSDNSMAYQHIVWFVRFQNTDKDGWYKCSIEKSEIPKHPDTHLSGIVLMNYIGNKYEHKVGSPMANAYLYNATEEMAPAKDRNILSPELKKLYEAIR